MASIGNVPLLKILIDTGSPGLLRALLFDRFGAHSRPTLHLDDRGQPGTRWIDRWRHVAFEAEDAQSSNLTVEFGSSPRASAVIAHWALQSRGAAASRAGFRSNPETGRLPVGVGCRVIGASPIVSSVTGWMHFYRLFEH